MEAPIQLRGVSHHFGSGALRRQILFDVEAQVSSGEIVIMTGPSGSGKTTLLTLIGALRSTQAGSLKVLGHELRGAAASELIRVRRKIGFIFQLHNLMGSLTVRDNVRMSLRLHAEVGGLEAAERAVETLQAVGLGDRLDDYPEQLSGGQKQRVAIARALVTRPKIILADEPTASLDKKSGRDVVERMQQLAKGQGCTVLLVTHDNRILDVADRILHMEDGRLKSFAAEAMSSTRKMLDAMARTNRSGELAQRLSGMSLAQFTELLSEVTSEFEGFLRAIRISNSEAFESMLEQVLQCFTTKMRELLRADRATLFLVDEAKGELWSRLVDPPMEIRIPLTSGIAGHVARTGEPLNIDDPYANPLFNRRVDDETGYTTRSLLCMPIVASEGRVFAVMQLLNKEGGPFTSDDEVAFRNFVSELAVILETWTQLQSLSR